MTTPIALPIEVEIEMITDSILMVLFKQDGLQIETMPEEMEQIHEEYEVMDDWGWFLARSEFQSMEVDLHE